MAEERFTGVVMWFNNTKGFGFIKPDDGGEDLFVHQSSIRSDGYRTLHEGDRVQFSIATGDNHKTKAVDVTAPDGNPLHSRPKESGGSGFGAGWRRNGGASGGGGGAAGSVAVVVVHVLIAADLGISLGIACEEAVAVTVMVTVVVVVVVEVSVVFRALDAVDLVTWRGTVLPRELAAVQVAALVVVVAIGAVRLVTWLGIAAMKVEGMVAEAAVAMVMVLEALASIVVSLGILQGSALKPLVEVKRKT
ncbi:hypothetical protein Ahy_A01g003973 isoform C [Arachis hypogaea]|uniref:CSD domain-containing protein n=1 Tax=Arachis hypogaea TaxID=3818 RepID=A0A445EUD0_ARAHY|nr:hypothetical protein Ahy_A01g003973 isoform C [Arachis hypogaea]